MCNFTEKAVSSYLLLRSKPWASQVVLLVKSPPANARDTGDAGWIPPWGRFPGARNGKPLQYSCLHNSMGRGAWQSTVCGATKLDMTEQLSESAEHTHRPFRISGFHTITFILLTNQGLLGSERQFLPEFVRNTLKLAWGWAFNRASPLPRLVLSLQRIKQVGPSRHLSLCETSGRELRGARLFWMFWSIVALQCCVGFYCTARWNQLCMYMYHLFFGFPSCLGHHRALSGVSCAVQ